MQSAAKCGYFFILYLALVIITGGSAKAQASSYEELQAAYLYNFAKYIRWPEETETFRMGIIGSDKEILQILTTILKNKKINGKPLVVDHVIASDMIESYHILYFPNEESKELESVVERLKNKSVLIVTEKDLIKKGATISFMIDDNKLRFKLSKQTLERARLVASEGLLKLAILQ